MAWATANDVIDAWIGDDVPADSAKVDTWIARAERLIRATFPNIQERIDAGDEPDLQDNIVDVVVAMVTRVFRNPQGYRSLSGQQTAGPYSGNDTITFGGDNPGALALTDDEKALLGGNSADKGDAFSVDMLAGYTGSAYGPGYWFTIGRGSEW